jgi:hypothetical protein
MSANPMPDERYWRIHYDSYDKQLVCVGPQPGHHESIEVVPKSTREAAEAELDDQRERADYNMQERDRAEAELERLREALRELVRLKAMKGKPIEMTEREYQAAKDAAWDAARAALSPREATE